MIKSEPKEMRAMSAKYFIVFNLTDDVKMFDATKPELYKMLEVFISDDNIVSISMNKTDFKYKAMRINEN